jgi:hypothetical protein
MSARRSCLIFVAMSLVTALASADEFDGSQPLECLAKSGRDCLPTKDACGPLKAESNIKPVLQIDVAKKEVHSPYRTALLPILYTGGTEKSLILQGADLGFAWSAIVNKATGAITISIADRLGAYVIFGQCKAAATNQ